jgi:ABC-2 type transport system permease protein
VNSATEEGAASDAAAGQPGATNNTFLGDLWVNFKRWNLKAIRNPFVLVVSLVQPIIFLVLFTQVFGGIATGAINRSGVSITYETYLVPAIAMQVALAAAATSGVGLVNDIEQGMFEKILVSPMSRVGVFAGKSSAELLRIAVQIAIILGLGIVLGATIQTGVVGAVGIVAVGILFSIWFMSFSNIVAVITRDQESTIIGANLLQFPLLFVSTAFLPLEVLPGWIQTVAAFNPVTYGVDAARAIILDQDVMTVLDVTAFDGIWNTLVPALGILLVLDVVFGAAAVVMLQRATSADVE